MALVAPFTWVALSVLTASKLNEQLRDWLNSLKNRPIIFPYGDVSGEVITTGYKGALYIPVDLTITGWTLIGDASGSIVWDVYRAAYPTIPTVANTIAGSEKPTLTSQQVNQKATLATWTTSVPSGSNLGFNVDSVATVKQTSLTIHCTAN